MAPQRIGNVIEATRDIYTLKHICWQSWVYGGSMEYNHHLQIF